MVLALPQKIGNNASSSSYINWALGGIWHASWNLILVVLISAAWIPYADDLRFRQSRFGLIPDFDISSSNQIDVDFKPGGGVIEAGFAVHKTAVGGSMLAFSYRPGEVILLWTAPGDDGPTGRAVAYDIRYLPVVLGPIDSEARWQQSIQVLGEPSPSQAGATDSMIISGLDFGAYYYFSIKTIDDSGNYSALSNSPLIAAGDTVPIPDLPGDANGDGAVNGMDVTYLVEYFKGSGAPPDPLWKGDANGNCRVDGIDIIYIVNFFKGRGPGPVRGDCDWTARYRGL
jgi:hypothetical protein